MIFHDCRFLLVGLPFFFRKAQFFLCRFIPTAVALSFGANGAVFRFCLIFSLPCSVQCIHFFPFWGPFLSYRGGGHRGISLAILIPFAFLGCGKSVQSRSCCDANAAIEVLHRSFGRYLRFAYKIHGALYSYSLFMFVDRF